MQGGWVYMMTNRPDGTLYIGVTSNLAQRVAEHKEGLIKGFAARYGPKLLVWAEYREEIVRAIRREKNLKHWPRAWKVELITKSNPGWEDLALYGLPLT
jgi:putative endonuclease